MRARLRILQVRILRRRSAAPEWQSRDKEFAVRRAMCLADRSIDLDVIDRDAAAGKIRGELAHDVAMSDLPKGGLHHLDNLAREGHRPSNPRRSPAETPIKAFRRATT